MTRRMVDKSSKHKRAPVERGLSAGQCPSCGTWLYCRDGTHTCVSTDGGPFRPQR